MQDSLNKFLPASNLKAGIHLKTPDGQTAVVVGGTETQDHEWGHVFDDTGEEMGLHLEGPDNTHYFYPG